MMMQWIENAPSWILLLGFPVVVLCLFVVKKVLFVILRRLADKTSHQWDNLLIDSIDFPFTLILLAVAVGFSPFVISLSERWEAVVGMTGKLIAVLAIALFAQKILLAVHRKYEATRASVKTYSGVVRVIISVGVYGVFLLVFLDSSGISVTPRIASLGVGGIAVALALQDTLANFFSGVYMVIDQPIRVGDFIKLESGEEGHVLSIGWRGVRICMLGNNTVIIPNAKLAGSIITNYDFPEKQMSVLVQVGVAYSSDLEKVERVTVEVGQEVMKEVAGGIPDFVPFIRYHTFDSSSINFTVILKAREFVDKFLVKHEFVKRLQKRYAKEGINIPFPIRTVHLIKEG